MMILSQHHRRPEAAILRRALGTETDNATLTRGVGVILIVAFILLTATHMWGRMMGDLFAAAATSLSLTLLCALMLARPVWGIIILGAVFPVAGILPPVGFTTSAFPVFGAATLTGYLIALAMGRVPIPRVTVPHIVAAVLVLWIVASNPAAAISMGDRVWLWTYVQLLVLMFLTTQLLDESAQKSLLVVFVVGAMVSAYAAMHQVQYGLTSATSVRARGLAEGANDAGRYFVIAIVFLVYLRHHITTRALRWASLGGIMLLFVGLAATVSRTSVLLLVLAIVLMLMERSTLLKERLVEVGIALAAAALLLIPSDYWRITSGILSSIMQGRDSVGFRYMQWDAGLAMWADHPLRGVGIGQFENNSVFYGTNFIPFYGLRWSAHNTYVTMLAETGAVGFGLFLALIVLAGIGLQRGWSRDAEKPSQSLYYTWLTVFAMMLIGAITGDDHVHKFLWMIFGLGASAFPPLGRKQSVAHTTIAR